MGSPFNLDSFLADIDERFNLDNDQIQDQDQAAANENNSAELADVGNEQLGALDQDTSTPRPTPWPATAAPAASPSAATAAARTAPASVATAAASRSTATRTSTSVTPRVAAGLGFGGTTGDGGDASADGGDGGSNDVDVDVDADADQDFDSDQDVEQDSDQDGDERPRRRRRQRRTDIDNETDVEDESEDSGASRSTDPTSAPPRRRAGAGPSVSDGTSVPDRKEGEAVVAFSDIIDFLLRLLSDETARAEFEKDPQATLGKAGLEGVSAQDVRDARLQLADSGAVHATDDGGRSASHHHDPVREIGHTTAHYAATRRRTTPVVARRHVLHDRRPRHAVLPVDLRQRRHGRPTTTASTTVTAIQDNDVNVSDDDVTIDADGLVQLRQRRGRDPGQRRQRGRLADRRRRDRRRDARRRSGRPAAAATPADAPAIDPADDLAAVSGPAEVDEEPVAETPADEPADDPVDDPADDLADDPATTPTPTPCRCEAAMTSDPVAVVERARAAIARYDRPDLDERLAAAHARLLDDRTRVLVVGEFKQGKSLLVNGLVGRARLPDVRRRRHGGARPSCGTPRRSTSRSSGPTASGSTIPGDELADHVCEQGNPGNREGWSHAEVGLPRPVLSGGLEIVDTPGVGGLASVHGAATTAALPSADAVLLVSDAAQEYTGAGAGVPRPRRRRSARTWRAWSPRPTCTRSGGASSSWTGATWPRPGSRRRSSRVSSTLRWHAVAARATPTSTPSPASPSWSATCASGCSGRPTGWPGAAWCTTSWPSPSRSRGNLRRRADGPAGPGRRRRADPRADRGAGSARPRSRSGRRAGSRPSTTAIADLNADIDYDLRDRMKEISRLAEDELLDGGDPAKVWDQFAGWVQQEVAAAASANFIWATQRVRALAQQVAEHFSDDRDQLLPALRSRPVGRDPVGARDGRPGDRGRRGWATKALTGLRGGYIGMLMFGMLGTFVGFASRSTRSASAPRSCMGGKAIGDERKKQVARRQNEAKAAMRRYVDDVTFQVAKDSRDRLRAVQRDLRDHFTAQADQLKRSLLESQQAAERAVKASRAEREARLTEIAKELEQLELVRKQARALLPQPAAAEGAGRRRGGGAG